jgi:DNA recombination protein RmuC
MLRMEWVLLGLGLVIGAGLGWVLNRARVVSSTSEAIRLYETRTAAAEARTSEVREQLTSTIREVEALRETSRHSEVAKTIAETQASEMEKNLGEQKALLEEAKTRLSDAFKSLASDALASNNSGFLTLAEEKFRALKDEAAVDLDARRKAIPSRPTRKKLRHSRRNG